MREIIIIRVYFFTPRYFLISCAPVEIAPFDGYGSKDVFPRQLRSFWGANKIFQ